MYKNQKLLRYVSAFVVLTLLFNIAAPMSAFALTGGPSQPEVESFEPVSTTQMVNPFTGDFTYNIPLLTVPGPNGGYPINMAYHAGVGMEQEASWVGLGWNVNVGSINRIVRGLPDDFKGDDITKTLSMKESWTVGLDARTAKSFYGDKEIFGANVIDGVNGQIFFNNFKGVGFKIGATLGGLDQDASGSPFASSLSLSYSTDGGLGVNPSISFLGIHKHKGHFYELGFGFNSREGLTGIRFNIKKGEWSLQQVTEKNAPPGTTTLHTFYSRTKDNRGAGANYSAGTFVPFPNAEQAGTIVHLGIKAGNEAKGVLNKKWPLTASVALQFLTNKSRQGFAYHGFGYMYEDARTDPSFSNDPLMDYNVEKDVPVTKNSPILPIPVFTNDIYTLSGQGIGGVFVPHRSDYGILYEDRIDNTMAGGNMSFEVGVGHTGDFKVGSDWGVNISHSYSGGWENLQSNTPANYAYFRSQDDHLNNALYEPFYFEGTGEMGASNQDYSNIGNDDPVCFKMGLKFVGKSFTPKTEGELRNSNFSSTDLMTLGNNVRPRERRSQHIAYRTNEMITSDGNYGNRVYQIYAHNNFPSNAPSSDGSFAKQIDYTRHAVPGHHIGEIAVTNPDGNRYVYGLPALNTAQSESVFSVNPSGLTSYLDNPSKTYTYTDGDENSKDNHEGEDHFYSKTQTPVYAYSYLLTAVYSPDYVDLTGDGPTADDLGYYVKFNYSPGSTNWSNPGVYKWRVPYKDASAIEGNISNFKDDKATYAYGEKEVYYLNSVETKTHIAEFHLNYGEGLYVREDGVGANDEANTASTTTNQSSRQLFSLESIKLFSKNDRAHPIKEVHFEYNYELCPGIDNSFVSGHGKLTLKKVWFTFLGNGKGQLNPYEFDYGISDFNPSYDQTTMDRWGNYQADVASTKYNIENPYVVQQKDYDQNGTINSSDPIQRDRVAGAWCLKKITLPSGGEINVNYESDDYAYVQDKQAMEMVKITALGDGTTTDNKLTKDNLRVYFALDEPIAVSDPNANAKLQAYASGLSVVYFKTFQKLKKSPTVPDWAYDYVEGYAKLANSTVTGVNTSGTYNSAYVELQPEHRFDLTSTGKVHPFKKAGWQYLRMSRPDLFDSNDPVESSITNMIGACTVVIPVGKMILNELPRLLNYYTFCELHNYCYELNLSTNRPSYIRLLNPSKRKFGGGHRVKKITISDHWDTMVAGQNNTDYGQEFQYVMPDGSSSGVAEYEPLIGGEEIPQRLPLRYNSDHLLAHDESLYLETPFGESLYPAANVGYRRVIIRNLSRLDDDGIPLNTKTSGGITVNEFYTAKEFPVLSDYTDIQHKPYKLGFFIPCVGWQSFNNHGYSQGFRIQLNDMHGRPKSVATYKGGADIDNVNTQPVSKMEYKYKVKGNYNPDGANYLDSKVTVLDKDGAYRSADIGKNIDFYTEMRQHSNQTINTGMSPNVDVIPTPAVVPTLYFFADYSESYFRSAVSVKIIRQNGILDETVVYTEGATAHKKNLMYDAETGEPLLTSTYNDFEKPVYDYNYPAWWAYDNMGGKWSNWNAHFFHMDCTAGVVNFPNSSSNYANPSQYFKIGDKVGLITRNSDHAITAITPYWVDQINDDPTSTSSDNISLIDEDNNSSISFSDAELIILESGRSNQVLTKNGALVSLKNPVTDRTFTLFSLYNSVAPSHASGNGFSPFSLTSSNAYTDCASGNSYDLDVSLTSDQVLQFVKYPSGQSPTMLNSCSMQIVFRNPFGVSPLTGITNYTLERRGSTVVALNGTGDVVNTGDWIDPDNCLAQCMDGVLQASAVEFKDAWGYNYEDVGTPQYKTIGMGSPSSLLSSSSVNPYRFGQQNIWRNYRSFAYQTKRKQTNPTDPTQTDIGNDGTFEKYTFYNWNSANNPDWTFVSEATRYSPYGYQIESKDALGIYSSALYGYNNSCMAAMSSNTSYFELAYEGFEDYASNTYASPGHGHLYFTPVGSSTVALSTAAAHTGAVSYLVTGPSSQAHYTCTVGSTPTLYFMPTQLKNYHFSVWVKPINGAQPQVVVNSTAYSVPTGQSPIEGWYRIDGDFAAPANTVTFDIRLSVNGSLGGAAAYFDDFRLQPFQSSMSSYVYDPVTLWLVAQLDDRNFATFFNYDQEGSLVQVKKETERGIMTIKTTRNNLQRN